MVVQIGSSARFNSRIDGLSGEGVYARGDIDLLPVGSTGAWEVEPASRSIRFHFTPGLFHSTAEDIGLDPRATELEPQLQARDTQIGHIAAAIDDALSASAPVDRLYAQSLGTALLARIVGRFARASSTKPKAGLAKRQLQRVLDYVDAHTDEHLSLSGLAAVTGLSVSHFRSQFRHSMGMPVHQYVIHRRVSKAKNLLLEGRSISQAAFESGFADQSHMARCMRKVLGMLPLEITRLADCSADVRLDGC